MRLSTVGVGLVVVGLMLGVGGPCHSVRAADDPTHKHDAKSDGHGHESKPFSIFPDKADLGLWSLVVFLILFGVLSKYAWKPMVEGLQKREMTIREAIEAAAKARAEAESARASFASEAEKAQQQVRALLDEARRDAATLREEELAKTKSEIAAERERAHREIEVETDQALQKIWSRAADLATQVSSMALKKQLDESAHRRLIDEALGELKASNN
ncbi:MAG: F0F1 ATP synthase subunit B [Gemmataceae bacterium]